MKTNKYSLFTTIAMIVGVVIGSGIFFKSDNILIATGGSIKLGILLFVLAAIAIIFGSLTIAELACRNDNSGGIIAYAEDSYNKSTACAFGWFQTFLYFPTLTAVIAWVSGIFICMLFGIASSLLIQVLIGLIAMIVLFLTNMLSAKIGGYIQNIATVIKLIPLIIIAIAGLIFGNPSFETLNNTSTVLSTGWIAAIAPISYSFDGWIIATSISSEIENPKKNLPLALIISPLLILAIYIAYFVGISIYVGPSTVMNLGDAHVAFAATKFLGNFGSKILLIFVVISILGTLNGLILGSIRLPNALAIRGMYPKSKYFSPLNDNLGVSIPSAIITFIIALIWLIIHYLTQRFNLLPNSDISEISIAFNYLGYILLYIYVFKLKLKGEIKGFFRGFINPVLAILGSLMILLGSFNNPMIVYYGVFCSMVVIASLLFWRNKSEKFD